MNAAEKIRARAHVLHCDDERDVGNGVIVMLQDGFDFVADPGCGTRGFDTLTEAEKGTRVNAVRKASA